MKTHHPLRIDVINRETGRVEATMKFFPSEVEMPGYIEHIERGYEGTAWRTVRRYEGAHPATMIGRR